MRRPTAAANGHRSPAIRQFSDSSCTIWLAREQRDDASYFYGGTRLIDPSVGDDAAIAMLLRLTDGESGTKNRLINQALCRGALAGLHHELPAGFVESQVAGARCLIRPHSPELAALLVDPLQPDHDRLTAAVLERVGGLLNEYEPRIKLTPDFGRFAGLADILHRYTPNVLGVRCDRGGCGGKSSYSVTGVLAGLEQAAPGNGGRGPVTCIGSAGAMGSGVLQYFRQSNTQSLAACDLVYDTAGGAVVPGGCLHLRSRPGSFTAECLARGGLIVPTTVGNELAASPWQLLPAGTVLLLAHNLALPAGQVGMRLARALARNRVLVIPGQVLTLGGALTARLEWYWRQLPSQPDFNKGLAHRVVHGLITHLMTRILEMVAPKGLTPYEAMLRLATE